MERKYLARPPSLPRRLLSRWLALGRDYRNPAAEEAFVRAIAEQPPGAFCLSVGGGPARVYPRLINLNIGPYANVDVAGSAYALPFPAGSVDAVFCEAVLEHLELPDAAVGEMFRVLRPGGQVFAGTPFLQAFHGYPSHYQNFTLVGHERLFVRAGFEVLASGTCVGPVRALVDLVGAALANLLPARLGRVAWHLWQILARVVRPLDRWAGRHPRSHLVASTTFVHGRKPA